MLVSNVKLISFIKQLLNSRIIRRLGISIFGIEKLVAMDVRLTFISTITDHTSYTNKVLNIA